MTYTRQNLLALAAQTRALAQELRQLQQEAECPVSLRRTLNNTRHCLGEGHRALHAAAERARDDLSGTTRPDLDTLIDHIQRFYGFTDFRRNDRDAQADRARAALVYVLAHDEGFSLAIIARALNRDEAAIGKAKDRASRAVLCELNDQQMSDISRYVRHMRLVLREEQQHHAM